MSKIEWTDRTWNPTTGCTKVSSGCKHCYAETFARRLQAMGIAEYANGFKLTLHPHRLDLPKRWIKPSRVFVNSMSDLFHEEVPAQFIHRVFETIRQCPHHVFQILTKRSSRLRELATELEWTPNIWMGVSVENMLVSHRVDDLRAVPAHVRFLSCEPLLGSLKELDLSGIHWVIAGGESGFKARPVQPEWVRELRDKCSHSQIPFFFKQWGGASKHRSGRLLDGRLYEQYPAG